MANLHDFSAKTIQGDEQSLKDYEGKVVLVVNVASKCGLTPQYEGLEKLQKTYGPRGFAVLGFPCNQFGKQEPGTEAEIFEFCTTNYGVEFPMFAKIEVNGEGRHPMYTWLTAADTKPDGPGDIAWNFAKFLIGKDGAVLARFEPTVAPTSKDVGDAIASALG